MINMPNKWTLTICLLSVYSLAFWQRNSFGFIIFFFCCLRIIIVGLEFHCACIALVWCDLFFTWCYSLPQKSFSSYAFLHALSASFSTSFQLIFLFGHDKHARTIKLTLTLFFLRLSSDHYTHSLTMMCWCTRVSLSFSLVRSIFDV